MIEENEINVGNVVLYDCKVNEILRLFNKVVIAKLLVEDTNPEGMVERKVHIVVFPNNLPGSSINVGDVVSVEGNTISNCKYFEGVIEVNNFKLTM